MQASRIHTHSHVKLLPSKGETETDFGDEITALIENCLINSRHKSLRIKCMTLHAAFVLIPFMLA